MIVWKDILKPIPVFVNQYCTVEEVIRKLTTQNADIAFVKENGVVAGYCTYELLIRQLAASNNLKEPILYNSDILKVPQFSPVEYFHNVFIIIGMDLNGEIIGYTSMEYAQMKLNEYELKDLNLLLHSSSIGIIRMNRQFQMEFMNETAEKILGMPSSFLHLRNYKKLFTIDKNLDVVLEGETLVNVNSELNFKRIIGNFYPLKTGNEITGLIHIFFLREVYEESVQELDFVRNLNSDLQAVFSSSQEQILVLDENGIILRVEGAFLINFWEVNDSEEIIGRSIDEFVSKGIFQPNVFHLCIKQKKKVTALQETRDKRKIWSVATPVYHEGKLEKVVVLSRDITGEHSTLHGKSAIENQSDSFSNYEDIPAYEKQLVFRSKRIESLVSAIKRVAKYQSTILLEGETGVGKEMFAQLIHSASQQSNQQLVRINCGAIPKNLIESELFGYEKGAFTGADRNGKAGLFEAADKSTLFLDEIAELPINMQVKLLRVLQEREVTRIGGTRPIPVNVRIVTATNRDLREMVNRGEFREDLYYRLNVIPFRIPSLRERKEDILPLSIYFLDQFNQLYQLNRSFTPDAIEVLETYEWPGNVRELQNIVERLILLSEDEWMNREHVLKFLYGEVRDRKKQLYVLDVIPMKEAVEELETQLIERGIKKYKTASKLSEILGVSPATISRRMKKLKK